MKQLRSSSIAACALTIVAAGSINAQTTATTDPVGFTTVTVRAKTGSTKATTTIVLPMELPDAYAGSCAGAVVTVVSGQTVITFPSAIFTANQFTGTANEHYFRLTSGSNNGDFSKVVANTTTSITLADDFSAVLVVSSGTASAFSLTPYWTLGKAFPSGGGLTGGTSATAADTITIYNASFVGTTYYYNTSNSRWQTGISASDNVLIPPGTGLAVARNQTSAASIVQVGNVPLGYSSVDINGSSSGTATKYTLVGSAYPLASKTLKDIGLYTGSSSTGVVGGTSATAADTITIYNPSTGVGTAYYYNTTNARWQTGISASDTVTIPEGASVLITRKSGRAPFTWYIPQPTMAAN